MFHRFATLCEAVAGRPGRNDKIGLVAQYLRSTHDELAIAARFASGRALPASAGALKLGGRQTVEAARRVWEFSDRDLREAYHRHGDLGAAMADLATGDRAPGLFSEPLTLERVDRTFRNMAATKGVGSGKVREAVMAALLADAKPIEVKYLVKLVTGDSRIGLRESLVVDSVAQAFERQPDDVRRALMATGNIGVVAVHARDATLSAAQVQYGAPIGFMLASPIAFAGGYLELAAGSYFVEDKFDGIRVQAHVHENGAVNLFSRRLNDVTDSYPEIASALKERALAFIVDGELLAWREGRALPFGALQNRLQRKSVDPSLLAEIPLSLIIFDLLAEGGEFLIDRPLEERRRKLEALPIFSERLVLSTGEWLDFDSPPTDEQTQGLERRFDRARQRGNEGVMIKTAGSLYQPGRRGRQWFKLKRELATLDCVVVGVEYGHGKRNQVLSDYTFAVRDGERLATIGKAYSGLTDAEIADRTEWFLAHTIRRNGRRLVVEPQVVVEIAFDSIQRSSLHDSGYALRFPRIVRLRHDKGAPDASTLDEVKALAGAARAGES